MVPMIVLIIILCILVQIFAVCLVWLIHDNRTFVVRRYPYRTAKLDRPYTFVFISDLHNKVYPGGNDRIYEAIKAAEPDAILIGGDMTIAKPAIHKAFAGNRSGMDAAITFLEELPAIAPTYFVNGNHEQRIYETGEKSADPKHVAVHEVYQNFVEQLQRIGITQLHNAHVEPWDHVVLYGYEHTCEHYEKLFSNPIPESDVADKVGTPDPGKLNILLAHNPKFYETYARWGADLVLSGHVHGGLLRIGRLGFIGPDLHLFPKYSGGAYYGTNGSEMVLSCGLGAHTLPIRIFNPGEISVVEILPENS